MSGDYVTPCADPANNAEDWFIEKDGKQYPDDDLLTDAARAESREKLGADLGREPTQAEVDAAHDVLEMAALKTSLTARRHAKDKCYVDCYFRGPCLDKALALNTPATHGTWGGYYQEELRAIRTAMAERAAAAAEAAEAAAAEA